ncbi:MAG: xanthine dehydrogenase small subunit [Bacteroidetes bacterium]|nr:xanthine dehydrogenase small subunit [Bacteroidota bacterium]
MHNTVRFVLDDKIVEIDFTKAGLKPSTTVLNYLRSNPLHKGVKEGCAEGDCGACTIVVAEPGNNGDLLYKALDSCLVFLPMIHGKQIITVENLAEKGKAGILLHPVQQMLVETNGTQCGYCTPGIAMSLFALFKNHSSPSREVIEETLTGNLCRCTGYQPLIEAAFEACKGGPDHFSRREKKVMTLLEGINSGRETLEILTESQSYYKPFTLPEALRLRKEKPGAVVISGSTDVALRQTKKRELLPVILDISGIEEMKSFTETDRDLVFGAALTLEQVKEISDKRIPALNKILRVFGSLQIRNIATLGGNIGSASPIGDTLPLLFALKANIKVCSSGSERIIPVEEFITGYRKTDVRDDELITEVIVPKTPDGVILESYKVSKRRNLDISTVSAGFRLKTRDGIIEEIALAFGGMAATPKRALKTEQFLEGKKWTRGTVQDAMKIVHDEFSPLSDARAGAEFRKTVAANLVLKFYSETT